LAEVEADLTRREADLRAQRDRVTALRARMSLSGPINDAVDDPGLVTYLAAVRSAGAAGPAIDRDGELLSLVGGDDATELGGRSPGWRTTPRPGAPARRSPACAGVAPGQDPILLVTQSVIRVVTVLVGHPDAVATPAVQEVRDEQHCRDHADGDRQQPPHGRTSSLGDRSRPRRPGAVCHFWAV